MATEARIVLFSWVWNPLTASPERLPFPAVAPPMHPLDPGYASESRRALGLVGWRVIGGNNRELGRSIGPTSSVEQAHQAVMEAQLDFDLAEAQVTRSSGTGWLWRISLGGERVVVSSRLYQRQRECNYNLQAFCELFPTAQVLTSAKAKIPYAAPSRGPVRLPRRTQQRVHGGRTYLQDDQLQDNQ